MLLLFEHAGSVTSFSKTNSLDTLETLQPSFSYPADSGKSDTLALDTIRVSTTGKDSDTVATRFLKGIGKISGEEDSLFTEERIVWSDRKTLDETLWQVPGFFVRSLGEVGAPTQLWGYGVSDSRIAVFLDGKPMNDPITESFPLEIIPLEYVEALETNVGKTAGIAASDVTLNIISRTFGTVRPKTKIRYVQEPNNTLLTDALFSQNVFRGANLSLGLNRLTSDGNYFNSALDVWNGRVKLRYNISQHVNLMISWLYHQSWRGMNYGVEYPQSESIFDPVQASVNDENAFEKLYRHDWGINVLAQPLADTAVQTVLTAYRTSVEREFRNPPSATRDPNVRLLTNARRQGISLQQHMNILPIQGSIGIQYQEVITDSTSVLDKIKESSTAYYGTLTASFLNFFQPSASYRREHRRNRTLETLHGSVKFQLVSWGTVELWQSWYDRIPTLQEQYWNDSLLIRTHLLGVEHHNFSGVGLNLQIPENFSLSLRAFKRSISNALSYREAVTAGGKSAVALLNVPKAEIKGLAGHCLWQWHGFEINSSFQTSSFSENDTTKKIIPHIVAINELSYRGYFIGKTLETRIGVRASYYDREYGMLYKPETGLFSEASSLMLGKATVFDVFGIFHIGDAHVSLTWSNVSNVQYIITPVHPMPVSMVKLGVHWEFLD